MPKYFCEFCGIYLIHSGPGGRKQHNHGKKHITNKIEYYRQVIGELNKQKMTNINLQLMSANIMKFNSLNPMHPSHGLQQPFPPMISGNFPPQHPQQQQYNFIPPNQHQLQQNVGVYNMPPHNSNQKIDLNGNVSQIPHETSTTNHSNMNLITPHYNNNSNKTTNISKERS